MIRSGLLVTALASLTASCAPRFDLFMSWTIDGAAPAAVCQGFDAPELAIRVNNRSVEGGAVTEELSKTACADGVARLSVASVADIYLDLLEGGTVYGTAGPYAVSPGLADDGYLGDQEDAPLNVDVELQRGRLRASFTVVGQQCAEAGASAFSVSVFRNTAPLEEDVIVDGVSVSCGDGEAIFELAPVELGSRYAISASTMIGGQSYATEAPGEGVVPSGAFTAIDVDLDVAERP